MIFEPNTGMSVISHSRMVQDAADLKALLNARCTARSPNSILSQAIAAAELLSQWKRDPSTLPHNTGAPEIIRRIVGLSYLARALFHARQNASFNDLKRLWKYLDQDNPLPTESLERPDTARNYVFELEVACHFMAKGLKVKTASEPDVIIEHPKRWNFACKMVSSTESNTVGNNLAKGWRQVLNPLHPCDYGMVIMGLGKRLDHNRFLPVLDRENDWWGAFRNPEIPKLQLLSEVESLVAQIKSQATTRIDDIDSRFRGVVIIAHALAAIQGGPMLLTVTRLVGRNELFGAGFIGEEEALIRSFNDAAQTVFME
jgi:hypothetical protein